MCHPYEKVRRTGVCTFCRFLGILAYKSGVSHFLSFLVLIKIGGNLSSPFSPEKTFSMVFLPQGKIAIDDDASPFCDTTFCFVPPVGAIIFHVVRKSRGAFVLPSHSTHLLIDCMQLAQKQLIGCKY
jgi:hypothetical protein